MYVGKFGQHPQNVGSFGDVVHIISHAAAQRSDWLLMLRFPCTLLTSVLISQPWTHSDVFLNYFKSAAAHFAVQPVPKLLPGHCCFHWPIDV